MCVLDISERGLIYLLFLHRAVVQLLPSSSDLLRSISLALHACTLDLAPCTMYLGMEIWTTEPDVGTSVERGKTDDCSCDHVTQYQLVLSLPMPIVPGQETAERCQRGSGGEA